MFVLKNKESDWPIASPL